MLTRVLTQSEIEYLVYGFWNNIDGGYCSNCSGQAVDVLIGAYPLQKEAILKTFREAKEEE